MATNVTQFLNRRTDRRYITCVTSFLQNAPWHPRLIRSDNEVFPNWSAAFIEFSEFGETDHPWNMNWAQFKHSVSHMSLADTVVASWSLTQEVRGSNTPFCKNIFYRFFKFFRIILGKTWITWKFSSLPRNAWLCSSWYQVARLITSNTISRVWSPMNLREGNIFTGVCLFTVGSAFSQCHGAGRPPLRRKTPPTRYGQLADGTHLIGMHIHFYFSSSVTSICAIKDLLFKCVLLFICNSQSYQGYSKLEFLNFPVF